MLQSYLANLTVKKGLVHFGILVLVLFTCRAGFVLATMDTYTAVVVKTPYDKEGTLYLTVKPETTKWLNTTKGIYKLAIVDSHLPFIAWQTRSERFDGVMIGDTICISDIGMRNSWFSWFPNGLDFKEGACPLS